MKIELPKLERMRFYEICEEKTIHLIILFEIFKYFSLYLAHRATIMLRTLTNNGFSESHNKWSQFIDDSPIF